MVNKYTELQKRLYDDGATRWSLSNNAIFFRAQKPENK